jgi:hypothetical protein
MNQNQITGIARALVPSIVAYVVGKGYLSQSSAADVSAAIIALLAAGWSVQTHTDANAIKTVAAMPDVKAIVAEPNPQDGMAAAVADTTQVKVISSAQAKTL